MSKYEPLGEFLRKLRTNEIRMTFEQIERVIGEKLPPKAQLHRAWWSNNPSNNVMTKAWLEAGFRSEQVDMEARKLVFRRLGGTAVQGEPPTSSTGSAPQAKSLIGWMKGTVTVAPGVDLTEPADAEWGKRVWGDQK